VLYRWTGSAGSLTAVRPPTLPAGLQLPDVIAELFTDHVAERLRPGLPYKCIGCHRRGVIGDGTAVSVRVDDHPGRALLLRLVHPRCATGRYAAGLHQAADPLAHPPALDSHAVPVLLPGPLGLPPGTPALVLEISMQHVLLNVGGPGGDADALLSGLLGAGFDLITHLYRPPSTVHPDYRVRLPAPGRPGGVYGRGDLVLYEPLSSLGFPQGWLAEATRTGRCVVYQAAGVGIDGSAGLSARLHAAVADGRVVGVCATVQPA
jgi:hypothetical protein